MIPPTPQTPNELMRECLGTIARTARDIEDCAMQQDTFGLETHFNFLKAQMNRLNIIKSTTRRGNG